MITAMFEFPNPKSTSQKYKNPATASDEMPGAFATRCGVIGFWAASAL